MATRRCATGLVLILVACMLLVAVPTAAWPGVRTHVFIGVGPAWWDPFWPYPYYPYGPSPYWWYPPPYYLYAPPTVVVEEPPVYIQRESPPAGYWYYCPSPNALGYYPSVPTCPEPWIQVPPRS